MAIASALVNKLIAGGKPVVALVPFCIAGFEGAILLGTLFNLAGMLLHSRLGRSALPARYDRRFSQDRYGLFIACEGEQVGPARTALAGAEEVRTIG